MDFETTDLFSNRMMSHRTQLAAPVLAAGALLLMLAGCAATARTEAPPVAESGFIVAGYHPYWLRDAWRDYDLELLDALYFFEIEVGADGAFRERHGWPDRWITLRQEAASRGTSIVPTLTLFNQESFEQLFSSPASSRALHENMMALVRDSPGLGGVQIDFEMYQAVAPEVRDNFTRFMGGLRGALGPGLSLSMYLPTFAPGTVYDHTALALHVDYFVVQGYDLHGRAEEHAGAVAGLEGAGSRNWRGIVARLEQEGVPRRKMVMGVPYFGYEWPTETGEPGSRTRGRGVTITYARVDSTRLPGPRKVASEQAETHGLQRDPVSGSPYYIYSDSTGFYQGWFDDAESLRAKYDFVKREGLRGVAIFPLGYGDARLDAVLREAFGGL